MANKKDGSGTLKFLKWILIYIPILVLIGISFPGFGSALLVIGGIALVAKFFQGEMNDSEERGKRR